ncbi:hypothetical protein [Solimonas flava]|uniref:hypothetical protein n=1 Tax=Solimonas flava TaxID=415849 RepID=UPI00042608EA|nr:hypothetical protein [Solimonas flava]
MPLTIDARWKAVALRLLQELWLPALIGCVWCWLEWGAMDPAQALSKQLFKNFAAGLFFGSFFVGNVVRVARQQFTEGKLLSHSQKLDALATRLEKQTDELISWMMGGSSQLLLECNVSDDGYFIVRFRHHGSIPIYDLDIELLWGHAPIPTDQSGFMIASNRQPIKRSAWQIIFPGGHEILWDKKLNPDSVHIINVDANARNGRIKAFIKLYRFNGQWILEANDLDWKPRVYTASVVH